MEWQRHEQRGRETVAIALTAVTAARICRISHACVPSNVLGGLTARLLRPVIPPQPRFDAVYAAFRRGFCDASNNMRVGSSSLRGCRWLVLRDTSHRRGLHMSGRE